MELKELAEIMNGRFDDLCGKIKELKTDQKDFEEKCRVRHTDLDKDMAVVKTRQGIIGMISAAVGGAIGLIR